MEGDKRGILKPADPSVGAERDFSSSKMTDPWHDTFLELRAMRSRMEKMDTKMEKLDKIEDSTSSLSNQVLAIVQKMSGIDAKVDTYTSKVDSNCDKVQQLSEEVSSLKALVEKQGKAILALTKLEENIKK